MALFPAHRERRFGDATLVGYLYAAPAAGALARVARLRLGRARAPPGTRGRPRGLGLGSRDHRLRRSRTALAGARLLALAGFADEVSAIFRTTMLLALTPDRLRGRLIGIEFMQVASAPTLGNLEAGVVASATSLRFSIASGGILCIAGTLVTCARVPALVRYDAKAVPTLGVTSSPARCTRSRPS